MYIDLWCGYAQSAFILHRSVVGAQILAVLRRESVLGIQVSHFKEEPERQIERIPKPPVETEAVKVFPIYKIFLKPVNEVILHCSSRDCLGNNG